MEMMENLIGLHGNTIIFIAILTIMIMYHVTISYSMRVANLDKFITVLGYGYNVMKSPSKGRNTLSEANLKYYS